MRYDPEKHHRRSIRLKGYDYTSPGGYFITLVAQGRVCLFGKIAKGEMQYSERGQIAYEYWLAIPDHFHNAELGAFVIMPNHMHGIIILKESLDASRRRDIIYIEPHMGTTCRAPTEASMDRAPTEASTEHFQKPVVGSIPTIVRTYKAAVTRKIVAQFGGMPDLWQRNYYEHIIRNDDEHKRIHLYIESNPLHWISDEENPEMKS
jgi:REP element-mobilizing transposase RayT